MIADTAIELSINDLYRFKRWHGLDGFGCRSKPEQTPFPP
jgi:hypothetical protein